MIKVAICDDENIITSQIENIILNICKREGIPVDTEVFYSGQGLEKEISEGASYDLICLDIQMANGDGITTAKRIREMDESVLLIYVSEHEKYMMELFRLDVFAFIKKPIESKHFENVFLDANRKICNQKLYFSFCYKNKEYKILCIDILYFESSGRKINVHVRNNESIEVFNGKMSEVEEWTANGKIPFLRIHQSYLVNYHHIKCRSKTGITLNNGTKLPISEERQKNFGKQYGTLLGMPILL
ncbi:LytR/AlgR family response regulator transcription factor [Anaerosporobacter sp.]|uniref:LytR/AlgR family response regulator transcription factor n=1 Tax=Anaerosporobacter sp. TaxID=1872529 RepID=UPI00286F03E8|nr:LytTR family DNA-binding domain-containing protein [Anaerosporobacter sp.]